MPWVEATYRVLDGPLKGTIVPKSDTVECDEDLEGCGGSGEVSTPRTWSGWETCSACGGPGRVLGYPDSGPPPRVELVEDGHSVGAVPKS